MLLSTLGMHLNGEYTPTSAVSIHLFQQCVCISTMGMHFSSEHGSLSTAGKHLHNAFHD